MSTDPRNDEATCQAVVLGLLNNAAIGDDDLTVFKPLWGVLGKTPGARSYRGLWEFHPKDKTLFVLVLRVSIFEGTAGGLKIELWRRSTLDWSTLQELPGYAAEVYPVDANWYIPLLSVALTFAFRFLSVPRHSPSPTEASP